MSLFIKICGLREAGDVDLCIEAGANAVGFVFAESVRRINPAQAAVAAGKVPATVRRVAVMRHPSANEWQRVLDEFAPDVLQTDAEDLPDLAIPEHVECWPVLREASTLACTDLPARFLYEGPTSGSGARVDWQQAALLAQRGQMILAGGLDAENVTQAVRVVRPWGIDVSSGVESSPGKKDIHLIRKFIDTARAVEQ